MGHMGGWGWGWVGGGGGGADVSGDGGGVQRWGGECVGGMRWRGGGPDWGDCTVQWCSGACAPCLSCGLWLVTRRQHSQPPPLPTATPNLVHSQPPSLQTATLRSLVVLAPVQQRTRQQHRQLPRQAGVERRRQSARPRKQPLRPRRQGRTQRRRVAARPQHRGCSRGCSSG